MDEEWKSIKGFSSYEVSSQGRIRKKSSERLLRVKTNQYGVVGVGLMKNGIQFHRSVPLLVANAFIKKPKSRGAFDTPINVDGNRYNNCVNNLMWRPRWFAVLYNKQFKERYFDPIDKYIRDLATDEVYVNSFEAAIKFGLLERDVVLSIHNRTFTWPTYQQFGYI